MAGTRFCLHIPPMPHLTPFEFLDIALPSDGDLQLILTECIPAEKPAIRRRPPA